MNFVLVSILILLSCILGFVSPYLKNNSAIIAAVLGTIAIVLMMERNINIVPDTSAYASNFDNVIKSSKYFDVQYNYYGFENGFMALNLFVKKLGFSYRDFFAIVALVELLLVMKASQLQKKLGLFMGNNYALFEVLYLGYFGIFYGAIALRAGIAISFAFLGSSYLLIKKRTSAWICFFLAFQFHHSIIILIVAILVCDKIYIKKTEQYKLWWIGVLIIWLARIGLIINTILLKLMNLVTICFPFMGKYTADWYTISTMGDGFFSKKNILYLGVGGFLTFLHSNKKDASYNKILTLYMVGLTLTFLMNEFSSGYRLSDMFLMYSVPLTTNLINDEKKIKPLSRSLIAIIVIFAQFFLTMRITGIVFS